jgi:hypothetical protein
MVVRAQASRAPIPITCGCVWAFSQSSASAEGTLPTWRWEKAGGFPIWRTPPAADDRTWGVAPKAPSPFAVCEPLHAAAAARPPSHKAGSRATSSTSILDLFAICRANLGSDSRHKGCCSSFLALRQGEKILFIDRPTPATPVIKPLIQLMGYQHACSSFLPSSSATLLPPSNPPPPNQPIPGYCQGG